jgi:hypothetical protein
MMLSALRLAWRRPAPETISYRWLHRDTERFDVLQPVFVGQPGEPSVAGEVVNISLSGAAIRIAEPYPAWVTGLNQSDEIWLSGLLRLPVPCWVVLFDDGVLRVHFSRDGTLHQQMREVIGKLLSQ